MKYKGYEAVVRFDEEEKVLYGEVVGMRDVVTFQADSPDQVETEFHRSVDDYLVFCSEMRRSPEKPFSGKFLLRMSPELQAKIAAEALREDISENKLINRELEKVFQ